MQQTMEKASQMKQQSMLVELYFNFLNLFHLSIDTMQQYYSNRPKMRRERDRVATSPRFLESESSPSPACLESSPTVRVRVLLGRTRVRVRVRVQLVSSPSPGVCGSGPNPSPKERNFPALVQVFFQNTINSIIVILMPLQDVSLC